MAAAQEHVDKLIAALRLEAGRSGAVEVLKLLRQVPVYELQDLLSLALPMAFAEAWDEVLELIETEASKA